MIAVRKSIPAFSDFNNRDLLETGNPHLFAELVVVDLFIIQRQVLAVDMDFLGCRAAQRLLEARPVVRRARALRLERRDASGQRGPWEEALIGTPVTDPEKPVEVLRTIHSFDPCLACASHVYGPDGRELATVTC